MPKIKNNKQKSALRCQTYSKRRTIAVANSNNKNSGVESSVTSNNEKRNQNSFFLPRFAASLALGELGGVIFFDPAAAAARIIFFTFSREKNNSSSFFSFFSFSQCSVVHFFLLHKTEI